MPVTVHATVRRIGQDEFAEVAYEVMGHVFRVHAEFGRLLREEIYHSEIARRAGGRAKVPIEVSHGGFRKLYFVDLLVGDGAVFEFKTVHRLTAEHRSQILQYLLLAGLGHGKLVNLRPESVQHEFLNTTLTRDDRTSFAIDDRDWDSSTSGGRELREFVIALLSDLGTGLAVGLYEEVLIHLLGGENAVVRDVGMRSDGQVIGARPMTLVSPTAAFRITAIAQRNCSATEDHLCRLLSHADLRAIQWINIRHDAVAFKTIHAGQPSTAQFFCP